MTVTLSPGPLSGTLAAIPSKSAAHRLFLAAALGDRSTRIVCRGTSQDIKATLTGAVTAQVTKCNDALKPQAPLNLLKR